MASNADDLAIVRTLRAQTSALERENQRLKEGGGGGTSPPVSDADLKPRVDFLHTAFLWLAGAIVTITVALAGLVLTVSGSNNRAISDLNREAGQLSANTADLSHRIDRVESKIDILLERTAPQP